MINLNLTESRAASSQMFGSLEEQANMNGSVDASQVELRDPIQWRKLFTVTACLTLNTILLVVYSH
jgi:hypothetical protein